MEVRELQRQHALGDAAAIRNAPPMNA